MRRNFFPNARGVTQAQPAPAGGARSNPWCRGCALILIFLAGPAAAQDLVVPSGQAVTLGEVLIDENPGELWLRFRFLAPDIARDGGRIVYDQALIDIDKLCADFVVPFVAREQLDPARIVISLSDRPVQFGQPDPEATQFFEAYRLESARCIWEEF